MTAVRTDTRKTRCGSGKVAFRSQGAAQRALNRIALSEAQAAVPSPDAPIRTYRCGCGAWHLTSQPKRETKVSRRESTEPRKRRKRIRRKPSRTRVLTLVPPPAPAPGASERPPEPVRVWEPTDPITAARRDQWRRHAEELARLNAEERLRPRRAAA